MPIYAYKAYDANGQQHKGYEEARNEKDLMQRLSHRQLDLHSCKIDKPSRTLPVIYDDTMEAIEKRLQRVFTKKRSESDEANTLHERMVLRDRIVRGDTNRMPTFFYTARNRSGGCISGEMEANDENDLANRLAVIGLELLSIKAEAVEKKYAIWRRRISREDTLIFCQQMEVYFQLDMLLPEILDAMRIASGSARMKALLWGLRNHAARGDGLTRAIRKYPHAFSRFFVSLVEVGELTGNFSLVMKYGARHLRWHMEFWRDFKRELRWPVFSLVLCSLLAMLVGSGIGIWLSGSLFLLWGLISLVRRLKPVMMLMDREMLKLPIIGKFILMYDMMQFTYLFGVMWNAGITAEDGVGMASSVMNNHELRGAAFDIQRMVHHGETLSGGFAHSGLFPPMVINAFHQGEITGEFSVALNLVYYYYTHAVRDIARMFITAIRVVVFIFTAMVVLSIAAQVYGK